MARPPTARDRIRPLVSAGFFATEADRDAYLDALVDAVLRAPTDVVRVYGVLLVHHGQLAGLGIYPEAHPTIGPGFTTHPLWSCAHQIAELSAAERKCSPLMVSETEARNKRFALRACLDEAEEILHRAEYAWAGDCIARHEFAPGIGAYRAVPQPWPTRERVVELSTPAPLNHVIARLAEALKTPGPVFPEDLARDVITAWRAVKGERQAIKEQTFGQPMGAARPLAQRLAARELDRQTAHTWFARGAEVAAMNGGRRFYEDERRAFDRYWDEKHPAPITGGDDNG